MVRSLGRGIALLASPEKVWGEIRDEPVASEALLLGTILIYAAAPLVGRALGHVFLDWPALQLVLDAILYPAMCLGLVIGLGLALVNLAPHVSGTYDREGAMRLAVYSSTPLFLSGLLHIIPLPGLHRVLPFIGIGWAGWLLYLGLHRVLGAPPERTIPFMTLLYGGFILAFVLTTQVLLSFLLTHA